MSEQAKSDQHRVLRYLYDRLASGDERFCTIPTILKNSGIDGSNQYVLALTDDLETAGLIITRQAYQMKGGRLFQITAAGIDQIDSGGQLKVDTSAWTGRIDVTEARKAEIRDRLVQIKQVILEARLPNSKHANAMALIEATEKLLETPDPLWPEIMRLLRSPVLANITGITGLTWGIISTILMAAN